MNCRNLNVARITKAFLDCEVFNFIQATNIEIFLVFNLIQIPEVSEENGIGPLKDVRFIKDLKILFSYEDLSISFNKEFFRRCDFRERLNYFDIYYNLDSNLCGIDYYKEGDGTAGLTFLVLEYDDSRKIVSVDEIMLANYSKVLIFTDFNNMEIEHIQSKKLVISNYMNKYSQHWVIYFDLKLFNQEFCARIENDNATVISTLDETIDFFLEDVLRIRKTKSHALIAGIFSSMVKNSEVVFICDNFYEISQECLDFVLKTLKIISQNTFCQIWLFWPNIQNVQNIKCSFEDIRVDFIHPYK